MSCETATISRLQSCDFAPLPAPISGSAIRICSLIISGYNIFDPNTIHWHDKCCVVRIRLVEERFDEGGIFNLERQNRPGL